MRGVGSLKRYSTFSTRRSFLRIGGLAPWCMAAPCMTPSCMARVGGLGAYEGPSFGTAKSCILLWLDGGPSHLETFDPKIDVPREVQGPLGTTPTSIPGVHFSGELGRCAKLADQMTIIRSMTSPLGEHGLANQYALSGYLPSPNVQYPSFGSLASHQRALDWKNPLPRSIGIPEPRIGPGAGFLGVGDEPFWVHSDPGSPSFQVRDLEIHPSLDPSRLERRREMLGRLQDTQKGPGFQGAFEWILSPQAKRAFDLQQESDATKE